ncbi:hypothetical protein LSTR_LSTR004493 [Laodelphax striatellus]|uniref:Dual specificity protein phosphatase n=1 Tax=Laodelphax striatellus TaxID=195883 RepID=A0A482XHR2_LAOST|nr:hypothetical protein LSTR_LSTR004493 [Laodelphax striatellus]
MWYRSSNRMATIRKQEEDHVAKELYTVLSTTYPIQKPAPGFRGRPSEIPSIYLSPLNCCDEVYPNIYVGDWSCAKNKPYLKRIGITHVLNTAEGKLPGQVDTDADYYKYSHIHYLGLPLSDLPVTNISKYFNVAADFIRDAIASGGKVLVHCMMGLSRSSTCVIAYLMIKEGMSASKALQKVRTSREVRPNNGFLQQLAELDVQLKRRRF